MGKKIAPTFRQKISPIYTAIIITNYILFLGSTSHDEYPSHSVTTVPGYKI